VIFGKRGFVYRLVLNHFVRTLSLTHILRLIATFVGSYSRSRRESQARNASTGGQALRRIYGHIVAQGFGVEKLTASLDISVFPHRHWSVAGHLGMASLIVLAAWAYWPERAVAPVVASTTPPSLAMQQLAAPVLADAQKAPESPTATPSSTSSAPSPPITTTKDRFTAIDSQDRPGQEKESAQELRSEQVQLRAGTGELSAQPAITQGEEDVQASVDVTSAVPDAEKEAIVAGQSGRLADLLTSLVGVTVRRQREVVDQAAADMGEPAVGMKKETQAEAEPQPTSASPPAVQPTAVPATDLVPGPQWVEFTPDPAPVIDHFWLGLPHPSGYTEFYSPNYQFGSTAGGRYRIHHGVDIPNKMGTPILAMAEGEVVHAGPDNPALLGPYNNFYGNAVVIRLNRRISTPEGDQDVYVVLGHMSEVYVERGQQVTPGDVVGAVGMTGIAVGPHLHVEVRVGQNSYLDSVNPALWMQNLPGTGAVAVRLLSADGRSWSGARLSLLRYENGGTRWVRTIEIYPDAENIGPDPAWGENGALSDLAAGAYWIGGVINGEKVGENITINAGETTFIELRTQQ